MSKEYFERNPFLFSLIFLAHS